MDTSPTTTSASPRTVNLRQAAKLAKVSEVTMRKHLKSGGLKGTKVDGDYGQTWSIDYDDLAAFTESRYRRGLSLSAARQVGAQTPQSEGLESARELRNRLDAALMDLGKYRALTESSESTAAEVERILKERIAELQQENEQLRELASRSWIRRLVGS
jgi:hypothetical protein